MPWFLVDDHVTFSRKVMEAGNAAFGAWVRMGAYCAAQLTDGFVPSEIAGIIATSQEIKNLVKVAFLHPVEGGYEVHEYLKYQRSKSEVTAKREAAKSRVRTWRNKQTGNTVGNDPSNTTCNAVTNGVRTHSVTSSVTAPQVWLGDLRSDSETDRVKDGVVARLAEAFQACGILMPDASLVGELAKLVREYATAKGVEARDVASEAVAAFKQIASEWKASKPPLPHLMLRHWEEVQAVMSGQGAGRAKASSKMAKLAAANLAARGDE